MTLNVNRYVQASVNFTPVAAAVNSFSKALLIGQSGVFPAGTLARTYSSLTDVGVDFAATTPEYASAEVYFSQSPPPAQLEIAQITGLPGSGTFTLNALNPFTAQGAGAITGTGNSMTVTVNGGTPVVVTIPSGQTIPAINSGNNGSAFIQWLNTFIPTASQSAFQFAFAAGDGTRFGIVIGAQPGTTRTISIVASGIFVSIAGFAAAQTKTETSATTYPAAIASLLSDASWYGVMFAAGMSVSAADTISCAQLIEAASPPRMFCVASADPALYNSTSTTDVGYLAQQYGFYRTVVIYDPTQTASASLFGRLLTVNFNGINTTLTMMYQQMPGVPAQNISTTAANALDAKRVNYFAQYSNGTNFFATGVCSGPAYIDEVFGTDWLQNAAQTAVFNVLYTSGTKVPQTDSGQHMLVTAVTAVLDQAVQNGLVAAGQWNAGGFGALNTGDYLKTGYYVYTPTMASQLQTNREQRMAPPITCAVKLAGAIHSIDVIFNINR